MKVNKLFINQEVKPLLEEAEVIKRLRERGEPIKLFGETPSEIYQRLRSMEMQEPTGSKSQTDFKSAMEKIDQVDFVLSLFLFCLCYIFSNFHACVCLLYNLQTCLFIDLVYDLPFNRVMFQEYLKAMMMELHGDKVERKELKTLASIEEMKEICKGKRKLFNSFDQ